MSRRSRNASARKARKTEQPVWTARFFEPVDIASLVFFRIAFGAIMIWQAFIFLGQVETDLIAPAFHFNFLGFGWVRPWPGFGMFLHLGVMAAAAALLLVGFQYRWSAIALWLTFTYVFLMDQALYQNHYYLVCLVSFLMIFVPADRALSLDARLRGPGWRRNTAPAWTLWMLRAQFGCVYFFAGLAKLNGDWLRGHPVREWLPALAHLPLVGAHTTEVWAALLVAWSGMLLDLLVVPALLWKRTRLLALAAVLFFHVTNKLWFGIGIFPAFSMAGTLLFFDPDWPRQFLRRPAPGPPERRKRLRPARRERLTVALLGVYFAIQLLLPLRHYLYEGRTSWTEEGHRFAWRQKLRSKRVIIRFVVVDPGTGRSFAVDPRERLTELQFDMMKVRPHMILQYAHDLADRETRPGAARVKVFSPTLASLNGREMQPLIDPSVDLAAQPRTFLAPYRFIVPLQVPLEAQWDGKSKPTHPVAVTLIEQHRERFQETLKALQRGP